MQRNNLLLVLFLSLASCKPGDPEGAYLKIDKPGYLKYWPARSELIGTLKYEIANDHNETHGCFLITLDTPIDILGNKWSDTDSKTLKGIKVIQLTFLGSFESTLKGYVGKKVVAVGGLTTLYGPIANLTPVHIYIENSANIHPYEK